uniref:Uncharacterized protein n=1 Tax=Arion vulgaris TaxID=1028688 RepID=A0A0B6ZS00_9EUPU
MVPKWQQFIININISLSSFLMEHIAVLEHIAVIEHIAVTNARSVFLLQFL